MAVVDECYPSECVKFRSVLSPTHTRFRVNGAPNETEEFDPLADEVPVKSPPVKPVRRKAKSPTPQPLSESEPSLALAQPVAELPREETTDTGPSRQRDVLDDILDKAKAVKDLVWSSLAPFVHSDLLTEWTASGPAGFL